MSHRPPPFFHAPDGTEPRATAAENIRAAEREAALAALPKRFWRDVSITTGEDGLGVALDGRPARTPGKRPLRVPGRMAAEALAAEWRAVGERLDPSLMPLTRLVNSALDGVADRAEAVRADILAYAGCDLICYRAAEPQRLATRQRDLWDPALAWAGEALGARLDLAEGVMFIEQPAEALGALARAVDAVPAPHALAALHVLTTLTGSAILGLALAHRAMTPEAVWEAANLDEDVQMAIWGEDKEALGRRAQRRRDFDAAVLLLES